MNNRIQQRFDRSIREAVEHTKRVKAAKPRRRIILQPSPRAPEPKGRLYLCPQTGATVWEPTTANSRRLDDTEKR